MLLIAGGTGVLGTRVVRLLTARGLAVRILTRDPARARHLEGELVEVVPGDVREAHSLERAMEGVQTVISAIQGFQGPGHTSPRTVDYEGNSKLIQAARGAGARHFILISIHGAAPNSTMELFRMKYLAQQELQASGLAWTIIRPTALMETWLTVVGEPLLKRGKTRIFGRGVNFLNFVSADDVAQFVALAVVDPSMQGRLVDVGGPENLSMRRFVAIFQAVMGTAGSVSHVPLPMMRMLWVVMRPVKPALARLIQAGVAMDTRDMPFDPTDLMRRYPSISLTPLADVVRRNSVGRAPAVS
jgi:uncharacterized protein YbjT (DUF2867 family)